MPRWLAIVFAVAAAASDPGIAVKAAPFGTPASGGIGSTHRTSPAIPPKGASNHAGASDARPGGHTGANPALDFGGHGSGGWYQRGFGGTRDPGWGYNFGPHLGGVGR
jgi:hypothetical protein